MMVGKNLSPMTILMLALLMVMPDITTSKDYYGDITCNFA